MMMTSCPCVLHRGIVGVRVACNPVGQCSFHVPHMCGLMACARRVRPACHGCVPLLCSRGRRALRASRVWAQLVHACAWPTQRTCMASSLWAAVKPCAIRHATNAPQANAREGALKSVLWGVSLRSDDPPVPLPLSLFMLPALRTVRIMRMTHTCADFCV